MFVNSLYAFLIVGLTLICGGPIASTLVKSKKAITKIVFSFMAGFVILSLAGLVSNVLHINIFLFQSLVVVACAVWFAVRRKEIVRCEYEGDDRLAGGLAVFYFIVVLYFFEKVRTWMAADIVGHASKIRMLMDGHFLPVSIYPFGTYFAYYPKAFHLYSYFWIKLLPVDIIGVLQVVPIVITAFTALAIYSLVQEIGDSRSALYALVISCFVFVAHYSYLIWGGLPSAAAELLMVGIIAASIFERRLVPLLVAGIVFTHTRYPLYAAAVIFFWLFFVFDGRRRVVYALASLVLILGVGAGSDVLNWDFGKPLFISALMSHQDLALKYASMWYFAVLSLAGAVIAIFRRDMLDRLVLAWVLSILVLTLAVDTGALYLKTSGDRILLEFYIPLSILAGYSAYAIERQAGAVKENAARAKYLLIGTFTFIGILSMSYLFMSYSETWGLPDSDYKAMMWINEQGFDDAIFINLDSTGAWIYPLTGIQVANPEGIPKPDWYELAGIVENGPMDSVTLEKLDQISKNYSHVLIYISNVSTTRPNYRPPFVRSYTKYLNMKTDSVYFVNDERLYFGEEYKLIYPKGGSLIYEYKP